MKPAGILVFISSVFLLLIAGAFYFPEEGVRITDDLRLRFFSRNDLLTPEPEKYPDIKIILKQQQFLTDSVLTAIAGGETKNLKIPGVNTDSLINSMTRIEFPNNDSTLLYPLFRSLRNTVHQAAIRTALQRFPDRGRPDDILLATTGHGLEV
jgi:hypothetical protein